MEKRLTTLAAAVLSGVIFIPRANALDKLIIPIITKDSISTIEYYDNSKGNLKNYQLNIGSLKKNKNFYFGMKAGFGFIYGTEKMRKTFTIPAEQIRAEAKKAEEYDTPKQIEGYDTQEYVSQAKREIQSTIQNLDDIKYDFEYDMPRANIDFSIYVSVAWRF